MPNMRLSLHLVLEMALVFAMWQSLCQQTHATRYPDTHALPAGSKVSDPLFVHKQWNVDPKAGLLTILVPGTFLFTHFSESREIVLWLSFRDRPCCLVVCCRQGSSLILTFCHPLLMQSIPPSLSWATFEISSEQRQSILTSIQLKSTF